MNEQTVPLFVPPHAATPVSDGTNQPPLPQLIIPPTPTTAVISIARIDHSGRVAAIDQITALDWRIGDTTIASLNASAITIRRSTEGNAKIDCRRQILIPAGAQTQFRIHTGDKLLAAAPDNDVLIAFPATTLGTILAAHLINHPPAIGNCNQEAIRVCSPRHYRIA
ncbi:hypothetical protein Lesp02_02260 [Lentzea sp. NBRC 105346]|uniref:hypothetical protein n=1 Tax=Lentzea sp. NBRC 105346 TaxID=3032205 RepID=UPI0024A33175|nr:hypothetical protein [Lentzea sp. NBRC 105346]GLZ28036.1 hypothetical protein Lesp02_02260 [Lentzea sp. NBRC 105346]